MKNNPYSKSILAVLFLILPSGMTLCYADGKQPVAEMKADRTIIYPQRMELTGEETLLDILMMFPDLMQKGFDDMVGGYNLRIDNVAMNGDVRLLCTQIKAQLISKVQICDNPAVAKGTVGNGRVIDVNMQRMQEGIHGFAGNQTDTKCLTASTAEVRYGSKNTDIYSKASYTYSDDNTVKKNNQYLTFHMTNWFSPKDRLLTYFTQQYLHAKPTEATTLKKVNTKYLGRARYFHNFNDRGTELLLLASYQYSNNPVTSLLPDNVVSTSQKALMGMVELNTPIFTPDLSLMLGWEGDWAYNTYKLQQETTNNNDYLMSNNDIYVQLNYKLGIWHFTLGDRIMFYHYGADGFTHNDIRNNLQGCAILVPNSKNQIQLAYHHKFSNPEFFINNPMTEGEWMIRKGNLKAAYIDEGKLGYTFTKKDLTLTSSVAYLAIQSADNMLRCNVSLYWKKEIFALNAGANYYNAEGKSNDFATFMLAPKLMLPCKLQIMAKGIFYTDKSASMRDQYVYGELQANKQMDKHWDIQLMWHNIFYSTFSAAMAGVQYRF